MFYLQHFMDFQMSSVKGKSRLVDHWIVVNEAGRTVWRGPWVAIGPPVGWQLKEKTWVAKVGGATARINVGVVED